ncbi:alpha-tocopherol transfer protein isoform X2 [Folsomia candida]|uniref:alpha-tocopherol transfer protein isoform X2 n=1 Tax=Folsomia candida TaxID=158441 RepID=UPI001604D0C5|nr:alpha-tocopherol transfer protein isoform X2 [Folsomia candida]
MSKSKKSGGNRRRSIPTSSTSQHEDHTSRETLCLKELKLLIKESDEQDLADFGPFLNDRFLLHFVRGRKFRAKEAFATLKNYIKVRRDKFPEIFKPLQPSKSLRHKNIAKILKNKDDQGRLVIIGYTKHWDPKTCPADDLIGEISLYIDELMNIEDVERLGIVLILDLSGYGLKHAKIATPSQMHKLVSIFHSACPVRLKGQHIINEMYLFSVVAKSLLKLLPHKIQNRLHFHSTNMVSLHKFINPDILPKSLGGKLSEEDALMDLTELEKKIRSNENYYKQLSESWNDQVFYKLELPE